MLIELASRGLGVVRQNARAAAQVPREACAPSVGLEQAPDVETSDRGGL